MYTVAIYYCTFVSIISFIYHMKFILVLLLLVNNTMDKFIIVAT